MAAKKTFSGLDNPRIREILRRYAVGETQASIAAGLGLHPSSVAVLCRRHKAHVMALMDARDREAVRAAGILDLARLGIDIDLQSK